MHNLAAGILIALLMAGLWAEASADKSTSGGAAPESAQASVAPIPSNSDTSMVTGAGLNTKSWPIDRPVQGGVMRKLPGRRDWIFVRAIPEAEMQRLGQQQQIDLLKLHGSEPRDIELVIPDSLALRRLPRFGIASSCAPPCTLQVRVLYRQLPRLLADSLVFWGSGDRDSRGAGSVKSQRSTPGDPKSPTPYSARPRKPPRSGGH